MENSLDHLFENLMEGLDEIVKDAEKIVEKRKIMSDSKLIRQKKKIHGALYVIECPTCGNYAASSDDYKSLPDWTVCRECYPTKLLNDVIRMDYRKRYTRMGSKGSL